MVTHGIEELSYLEETDATVKKGAFSLTLKTFNSRYQFKINEAFQFSVLIEKDGVPLEKGIIDYELIWDQSNVIEKKSIEIVNGKGVINSISDKSGFIQVKCILQIENEEPLIHRCGVAISPELIEPSLERPQDFDEFWNNQKALLEKISVESTWIPIDHKSHPHLHEYSHKDLLELDISEVELNEVKVSCLEKNVSGIYTRPIKREIKKHPAMLCVQGAGVIPTRPHNFVQQAKDGILVYEMGAHGLSNFEDESYYRNLFDGELKNYLQFGRENRELSYFRLMYLRVKRGLDFLMAQPEWDGETLIIKGSSQGGAQCMAGAYLEPKVKMISASVPALCDHTGFLKNRSFGGGKLVMFDKEGNPDPSSLETSRYFDCVNFSYHLKCAGNFSVGLLDGGCSPSSIFAAYNVFGGPKNMHLQPYTGHANTPATIKSMDTSIKEFIKNKTF